MKKYIVLAVVFSFLFLGFMAPKVQAVTLDELQVQIQALSAQVASLSSQLAGQAISSVTGKTTTDTTTLTAEQAEQQAFASVFSTLNLKRGDRGTYVKNAQNLLKEGKYLNDIVDGIYGSKTVNAVLALQRAKNIPATGVIDLATKKVLLTLHVLTPYEKYGTDEINKYIKDNNVLKIMEGKSFTVIRETTNGQLVPSKRITVTQNLNLQKPDQTCTIKIVYSTLGSSWWNMTFWHWNGEGWVTWSISDGGHME